MSSRRDFFKLSIAISAVFSQNYLFTNEKKLAQKELKLIPDQEKIIDLPEGFSYQIISKAGDAMNDGLVVPKGHDGMAAFSHDGKTILLRNHELSNNQRGAFDKDSKLWDEKYKNFIYDTCDTLPPCLGGVSRIIYDTKTKKMDSHEMALIGTIRNCAGGLTPWGSWVTCEETVSAKGSQEKAKNILLEDHGYNFEVPANHHGLVKAIPLKEMGRFNHEAVAVDPRSGIVYETEDRGDGLFYRYIPNVKGELSKGGKLQALAIKGVKDFKSNNFDETPSIGFNDLFETTWIDLENVESPKDDLREQGKSKGCVAFVRGEGIFMGKNELFFTCTSGGKKKMGQVWKYSPAKDEGQGDKNEIGGTLSLMFEPNDATIMKNCDNLTITPWGDLLLCEDRSDNDVRLVGVKPTGESYIFANNHLKSEFAGACFSPDGTTLFVNIQGPGYTLAVTGPWQILNN